MLMRILLLQPKNNNKQKDVEPYKFSFVTTSSCWWGGPAFPTQERNVVFCEVGV